MDIFVSKSWSRLHVAELFRTFHYLSYMFGVKQTKISSVLDLFLSLTEWKDISWPAEATKAVILAFRQPGLLKLLGRPHPHPPTRDLT